MGIQTISNKSFLAMAISKKRWTENEFALTLDLYFRLKDKNESLGASNIEVRKVADQLGRTAASVAMRLQNYVYEEIIYDFKKHHPNAEVPEPDKGLKNGGDECAKFFIKYVENREGLSKLIKISADDAATALKPLITSTEANKIVIKLAVEHPNIDFTGDDGNLFDTLLYFNDILQKDNFSLVEIKVISDRIRKLPNIPGESFKNIIHSTLAAENADKLLTILAAFDPRFA